MCDNEDLRHEFNVRVADIDISIVINSANYPKSEESSPYLHTHPYYELVTSADTPFHIGLRGRQYIEVPTHTACLIPPGCHHCSYSPRHSQRRIYLRFFYVKAKDAPRSADKYFDHFHSKLTELHSPMILENSSETAVLMRAICEELLVKSLSWETMTDLLVHQLFISIARKLIDVPSTRSQEHINSASDINIRYSFIERWIDDNFNRQVTSDDLAAELGLSNRQLSRTLHELWGMSFREKLTERRMQAAVSLLSGSNRSVEKIAYSVGYTSFSGFHLAFCKRFGITASEYRKKNSF